MKSGTGKMKPEATAQMCTERRNVERAVETSAVKWTIRKEAETAEVEAERETENIDSVVGDRCKHIFLFIAYL